MTITITDETLSGDVLNKIELAFSDENVPVKEIIAARVKSEVEAYNLKLPEYFKGLIRPTDAEKTINGYKLSKKKTIDIEKQTFVAYDAFQKNAYLVLVDDTQVESLDQQVALSKDTVISFIKLTPLVGG